MSSRCDAHAHRAWRCPTAGPQQPGDPAEWKRVLDAFAEAGVEPGVLEAAAAEGTEALTRLVARHLMFPGVRKYTPSDLYKMSRADEDDVRALWRAMGFPLVPDDEVAFTDADLEALQLALRLFERAGMDRAIVLQQARTMGQAAARIAASHQDVIAEQAPTAGPNGDLGRAALDAVTLAEDALPVLDRLLVYMYRRHLAAATEQRLLITPSEEGSVTMSVGFADLVGFTALSQELDVRELAALVDRFSALTVNIVAEAGGRVIKTIGDEIMFAARGSDAAASLALALLDDVSDADGLPALRVGFATGPVILREGDVFGPPVNLASRLVAIARPDSALVDEATHDALSTDTRFALSPLAPQRLKGLGLIRPFRLRRAGAVREEPRRRHRSRATRA